MSNSNIAEKMTEAVQNILGWEVVDNPAQVGREAVNIIDCQNEFIIVTCTNDNKPYIEAVVENIRQNDVFAFTVKIIAVEGRRGIGRVKKGDGFGDKVWRYHHFKNDTTSIEVSFANKPEETMLVALRTYGFLWCQSKGLWYIKPRLRTHDSDEFVFNNFTQVQDFQG